MQIPTKNHYILMSDYKANQKLTPTKRVENFEISLMNLETKEVTTLQITPKSKSKLYKYFGITQKQIDKQYLKKATIWHINESEAINYINFILGNFEINQPLNLESRLINEGNNYCSIVKKTVEYVKISHYYFLKKFEQNGNDIVQITMTQETIEKIGNITEALYRFLIGQPQDLVRIYRFHNKTSYCSVLEMLETLSRELSRKYPSVLNNQDIMYNFYRTILEQRTGESGDFVVYSGTPMDFKNKIVIKKIY